jgi:3-deoxy-D-manno-octulosonate 8-phosphate phosphatase KdsC-like HAD superfamily phosphatase
MIVLISAETWVVKKGVHYTTKALAGHGAVREAVELVLKSKGIWAAVIDKARA